MAKTYSRSEITPDLLQLNIQYFFDKPVRDYKHGMDEIILTYSSGQLRWINIVKHWDKFCNNPPVVDSNLRKIAENLANTATESNMENILDIFEDLSSFLVESFRKFSDDDSTHKIIDETFELNRSIYDKSAQQAHEVELERQKEKVKEDEEEVSRLMNLATREYTIFDELKTQIADLSVIIEDLENKKSIKSTRHISKIKEVEEAILRDARERILEAKKNADKIADMMENEIKQKREAEELRKCNELIRRADEKVLFDVSWQSYFNKYTSDTDKPTASLFKNFLIDIEKLTPEQVDEIKVSADIYDDGIANFIEFDEELQRVKMLNTSNKK